MFTLYMANPAHMWYSKPHQEWSLSTAPWAPPGWPLSKKKRVGGIEKVVAKCTGKALHHWSIFCFLQLSFWWGSCISLLCSTVCLWVDYFTFLGLKSLTHWMDIMEGSFKDSTGICKDLSLWVLSNFRPDLGSWGLAMWAKRNMTPLFLWNYN